MTRSCCGRWIAVIAALGMTCFTLLPARAATIISVTHAADLAMPAQSVPSGYTIKSSNSNPITRSGMIKDLGNHVTSLLVQNGWTTGYHGWLNAEGLQGDPFVTYDFYGFKSASGAAVAASTYLSLVLGVQTSIPAKDLPAGAILFTDSSGTFGANNSPFVAIEIIFRVDNVLADVTGYYSGGDAQAVNNDTAATISAASIMASWLNTRSHPLRSGSLFLPLIPIVLVSPAFRRRPNKRSRSCKLNCQWKLN